MSEEKKSEKNDDTPTPSSAGSVTEQPSPVATEAEGAVSPEAEEVKKQDDRDRVRSGMLVSVHEKIVDTTPKGELRKRVQIFKGMVIARKHGKEPGASVTVRKQSGDVQVEKIYPIYSPVVERIIIDKVFKTRRSKLYFLRDTKKRLREVK